MLVNCNAMAAKQGEATVSLKIFVDKAENRVVLAESDKHFVDILLSFLTLPLGTIVRLVGKQSLEPAKIGVMDNLYENVENLSKEALLRDTCNDMLLRPRNIWENHLRNLKVNVDNSEPTKFFICSDIKCSRRGEGGLLSYYDNARCSCGNLMNCEIKLEDSDVNEDGNEDVFITGDHKFLITDDLQVIHNAPTTSIHLLRSVGIYDVKMLDERTLIVSLVDIINLLKLSLTSKTPLTDVFLQTQDSNASNVMCLQHFDTAPTDGNERLVLKLLTSWSDNKVFYAEADEDFVDFLLGFLLIPLGTVISHLGGNSDLGCIDNLHRSVLLELNYQWFVELEQERLGLQLDSEDTKGLLLNSGVSPQVSCESQLLNIREEVPLQYYCYSKVVLDKTSYYLTTSNWQPTKREYGVSESVSPLTLIDPKTPAGGFVTRPAMFMVSDDLKVTPLSSYSVSSLMTLPCHTNDLEVSFISIGEQEALILLKASLISTTPLTDIFTLIVERRKKHDIPGVTQV